MVEVKRQTKELAKALNVYGLVNVQYAVKDNEIFVIEVNPRASRTVPLKVLNKRGCVPVEQIS